MSVYYTGRGDGGISRVGLKKIAKTDIVMSALGDLDELNSLLGIIKNHHPQGNPSLPDNWQAGLVRRGNKKKFSPLGKGRLGGVNELFFGILEHIQENLFIIQAHVASRMFGKLYKPPQFSKEKVIELENILAKHEKQLKPEKKFIVPGSNESSAWLDFARTIARRAERSILKFSKKEKVVPEILAYLNRLSSLLFVMARIAAKNSKEKNPGYK